MIVIAKETLGFRCAPLSGALRLLMPTFSLPIAPLNLTIQLHCNRDAPLPPAPFVKKAQNLIFGTELSPGNLRRGIP